jgi:hypothetical protein
MTAAFRAAHGRTDERDSMTVIGNQWFRVAALAAILTGAGEPAQTVTATIDATHTAQPITKLIFGGFTSMFMNFRCCVNNLGWASLKINLESSMKNRVTRIVECILVRALPRSSMNTQRTRPEPKPHRVG